MPLRLEQEHVSFIENIKRTPDDNHLLITNTVRELCQVRDGTVVCDVVINNNRIQDIIDFISTE